MDTGEGGRVWIDRTLGHYRVEQLLATGGMGAVYRAHDVRLDRSVALKLLREDLAADAEFRARFVRESHAAAALDHPSILPVFDAGESDGVLYIATRLVDGVDLRRLLEREGPLPAGRALAIGAQVAAALDYAHARGVVHRDVKPANVLLVRDEHGDAEHVYLIDFGVSKRVDLEPGLTATGQFMGTPDYVAPEQVSGRDQDGRADQYALGCLLFECVVGTAPFAQGTVVDILHAHLHREPPSARSLCADVPSGLEEALARALAKRPEDRFPSCRDLIAAARGSEAPTSERAATRVLSAPVATVRRPTQPPARPDPSPSRSRRKVVRAALATIAALVGLGVAAVMLLPSPRSGRADRGGAATVAGSVAHPAAAGASAPAGTRASSSATTAVGGGDASAALTADWPAGASGYTVLLAALRKRADAEAVVRQAQAAGLDAGILRSDEHADLRPGYWVVFSGVDSRAGQAHARVAAARAAGFTDAYSRHVDAAGAVSSSASAAPAETVVYQRGAYALRLPASWQPASRSVGHGGYVESSWHPATAPPHVTLLVDHTPGYGGTPEQAAHAVRDGFSGLDGYRELAFGPTRLGSYPAWRWDFELNGVRKDDWFVTACQTGYALLGAAPAEAFDAYEPTFDAAAQSLSPTC